MLSILLARARSSLSALAMALDSVQNERRPEMQATPGNPADSTETPNTLLKMFKGKKIKIGMVTGRWMFTLKDILISEEGKFLIDEEGYVFNLDNITYIQLLK
jgi:hypothetical protein